MALTDSLIQGAVTNSQTQPTVATGIGEGLQQGMKLAQMKQQTEALAQQTQEMQEKLQQSKWNSFSGMMNTFTKASPAVQKAMKNQLSNRFKQIGADPNILDVVQNDPDAARNTILATQMYDRDPSKAAMGMQAAQSADVWNDHAMGIGDMVKQRSQEQLTQSTKEMMLQQQAHEKAMDRNSREQIASGHDQTRVDTANIGAGAKIERLHNDNVKTIIKDPTIIQMGKQYNNLDNAIKNMQNGDAPTEQSFEELQQTVRKNLGISGTSGVSERAATKLTGFGFSPAEAAQFLSMKPQDIRKYGGTPFIDHIFKLANNEMNNIRDKANTRAKIIASAHGTFYKNNPDLAEDFNHFLDLHGTQFGDVPGGTAQPKPPPKAADIGNQPAPQPQAPAASADAVRQRVVQALQAKYPNMSPADLAKAVDAQMKGQ